MTVTNVPVQAKDGTGTAFQLDMGSDSVTGDRVQKVVIAEPAGGTFITPAQDGTDATGVLPPAGAVGIRGWLSSIYNKLTGSLTVTGTFWQATQPVSAASLPLPTGAATSANQLVALPAGTNAIGSIIGRTTMATVTPAVTANGAYAAGNEIGGLMTFTIGGAGSGTLMSLRVTSKSILTTALQAYIFSANPANSTWTDKSAPGHQRCR